MDFPLSPFPSSTYSNISCPLFCLPNELLCKVFSYFHKKELLKVSRVCWIMHSKVYDFPDIWRRTRIDLTKQFNDPPHLNILKALKRMTCKKSIQELIIRTKSGLEPQIFQSILLELPNLIQLDIRRSSKYKKSKTWMSRMLVSSKKLLSNKTQAPRPLSRIQVGFLKGVPSKKSGFCPTDIMDSFLSNMQSFSANPSLRLDLEKCINCNENCLAITYCCSICSKTESSNCWHCTNPEFSIKQVSQSGILSHSRLPFPSFGRILKTFKFKLNILVLSARIGMFVETHFMENVIIPNGNAVPVHAIFIKTALFAINATVLG